MVTSEHTQRWPGWVLPVLTGIWLGCFVYLGVASRLPNIPGVTGRGESVALSGHFLTTLVLALLIFAVIRARDLSRSTLVVALVAFGAAAVAGGVIEVLQAFTRTRTPELVDWLFDALGGLVGVGVMVLIDRKPSFRPRMVTAAHSLGGTVAALAVSAFFIWPPIAPEEVTVYCPAEVAERRVPVAPIDAGTGARVPDGLVVLYTFQDSSDDVSGLAPALNLYLAGGANVRDGRLRMGGGDDVALSPGPAARIHEAAAMSGAFTVETWLRPADLLQRGPARIVSTSGSTDLGDVNFHVGQERTCLSIRVRTDEGAAAWLLTEGVFLGPQPAWHVAVTYDRGSIGVFVDGALVEQYDVNHGPLRVWDPTLPLLVGNEATLDRPFQGDIHLVAFYGRALDESEIAINYRAGAKAG
jgi:VanZ family protein